MINPHINNRFLKEEKIKLGFDTEKEPENKVEKTLKPEQDNNIKNKIDNIVQRDFNDKISIEKAKLELSELGIEPKEVIDGDKITLSFDYNGKNYEINTIIPSDEKQNENPDTSVMYYDSVNYSAKASTGSSSGTTETVSQQQKQMDILNQMGDKLDRFDEDELKEISELSAEEFGKIMQFIYIEKRGDDKQFDLTELKELLKLSDEQRQKAYQLAYIESRKDDQFDGYDIAQLAGLNDNEYKVAQQYINYMINGHQIPADEIYTLTQLSDADRKAIEQIISENNVGQCTISKPNENTTEIIFSTVNGDQITNIVTTVPKTYEQKVVINMTDGGKNILSEETIKYDNNGNVVEIYKREPSGIGNYDNITVERDGQVYKLQETYIDQTTGETVVKKAFESPSGTQTTSEYRVNENGDYTFTYYITDKDNNVLLEKTQSFEHLSDTITKTVVDGQVYIAEFTEDTVIITGPNNETYELDLRKILGENDEFAKQNFEMLKNMPANQLPRMLEEGFTITNGFNPAANYSGGVDMPFLEDSNYGTAEDLINTFLHEFGHVIDGHKEGGNATEFNLISGNEEFLEAFKKELEAFRAFASSLTQIDMYHFTDEGLTEMVAEANMILNGHWSEILGSRTIAMQQYFPETIAVVSKLIEKQLNKVREQHSTPAGNGSQNNPFVPGNDDNKIDNNTTGEEIYRTEDGDLVVKEETENGYVIVQYQGTNKFTFEYEYDEKGNPVLRKRTIEYSDHIETYEFDKNGNQTNFESRPIKYDDDDVTNNDTDEFNRDLNKLPEGTTIPEGFDVESGDSYKKNDDGSITFTIVDGDKVTQEITIKGDTEVLRVDYNYNEDGTLANKTTTRVFDGDNYVPTELPENGTLIAEKETVNIKDKDGNTISSTVAEYDYIDGEKVLIKTTETKYTETGKVVTEVDNKTNKSTETHYNSEGSVSSIVEIDGKNKKVYDAEGNLTAETRVTELTNRNGDYIGEQVIQVEYINGEEVLKGVTQLDKNGKILHQVEFDKDEDGNSIVIEYEYNSNGNVIEYTTKNGEKTVTKITDKNGKDITKEAEKAEKRKKELNKLIQDLRNGKFGTGRSFDRNGFMDLWVQKGGEAITFTGSSAQQAYTDLMNVIKSGGDVNEWITSINTSSFGGGTKHSTNNKNNNYNQPGGQSFGFGDQGYNDVFGNNSLSDGYHLDIYGNWVHNNFGGPADPVIGGENNWGHGGGGGGSHY